MRHVQIGIAAVALTALSCGSAEPAPADRTTAPAADRPGAPAPRRASEPDESVAAARGGCEGPVETLRLGPDRTRASASGLSVTLSGVSYDHFDDGSFDMLAELAFARDGRRESRLLSLLAEHPSERILGRCVQVRSGGDDTVLVDVGAPIAPAGP